MERMDRIQSHVADAAAAASTVSVGAYWAGILEPIALIVAIISGSLAATWHVYKFYQEYQAHGEQKDECTKE